VAHAKVTELRGKSDKAWVNLKSQLAGMDSHLEASDAPGQWTTRQVLCHLLFERGWRPVPVLKRFADRDLPVIDINPGLVDATAERQAMTLKQFLDALDTQRREVFGYLDGLNDADLKRKSRIPIFKEIMGNDEVDIPTYVGALFEYHWNDHAGQIAKIRKAAGLPDAK
jgi:DinB family protein